MKDKPVDLSTLKRKCMPIIETNAPSSVNWENLVGSGTYGLILGTIIEPDKMVVKIADKTTSCTTMDHEINLHKSAFDALEKFKDANSVSIYCPSVLDFAHKDACCWYYMQKIFKPTGYSKLIHTMIENVEGDAETYEKHSGIYPSPIHLEDIINSYKKTDTTDLTIENVARLNGTIFGILHYLSKQTGQDIEIVLGKINKGGKINVIFYDFDKSSFWEEEGSDNYKIQNHDSSITKEKFIKLLAISIGGGYATTIGKLGEEFIRGYLYVAEQAGYTEIATSVISNINAIEQMLLEGGGKKKKKKNKKIS